MTKRHFITISLCLAACASSFQTQAVRKDGSEMREAQRARRAVADVMDQHIPFPVIRNAIHQALDPAAATTRSLAYRWLEEGFHSIGQTLRLPDEGATQNLVLDGGAFPANWPEATVRAEVARLLQRMDEVRQEDRVWFERGYNAARRNFLTQALAQLSE